MARTAKKTTRKTAKKATKKKTTKTTARSKAASTKKSTAKKTTAARTTRAAVVKKLRSAQKPKNVNTLSYSQSEFLEHIRAFCGLEKRSQAKELWKDISAFISDALKKGYRIPLVGLGKLYVRKTKARIGRNPATGETIQIPARKRVRFTPAKALKETVL